MRVIQQVGALAGQVIEMPFAQAMELAALGRVKLEKPFRQPDEPVTAAVSQPAPPPVATPQKQPAPQRRRK